MIVDDFNVMGIAFPPHKTETELVVDSDAVLSLTVALPRFKTVRRRDARLFQPVHVVECHKLPHRHTPYAGRNPAAPASLVQQFRVGVLEARYLRG